jgi:hypothetical protein
MSSHDQAWIIFGKGMAFLSGLIFLSIAFYWGSVTVSLLLRLWTGFLGGLFVYASLRR